MSIAPKKSVQSISGGLRDLVCLGPKLGPKVFLQTTVLVDSFVYVTAHMMLGRISPLVARDQLNQTVTSKSTEGARCPASPALPWAAGGLGIEAAPPRSLQVTRPPGRGNSRGNSRGPRQKGFCILCFLPESKQGGNFGQTPPNGVKMEAFVHNPTLRFKYSTYRPQIYL